MRILRISAIIALGLAFGQAFSEGSEAKKEGQPAKCCAKAEKESGKKCSHSCCTESAKDGKNCEKCGGKN